LLSSASKQPRWLHLHRIKGGRRGEASLHAVCSDAVVIIERAGPELRGIIAKALKSGIANLRAFGHSTPKRHRRTVQVIPRRVPRIGVALGGGFARGLAHVGVLKVLIENGIPIDALAGVSAGSIIAAVFATGASHAQMVEAARRVRWSNFARWTFHPLGLASNWRMDQMLRNLLRCSTFEDLAKPLAVVAADIATGEPVVFRQGDLIPPLRASCSFPGLFTPVAYQGRLLVDGAIVASVPVAPLREGGVDAVIAVHLKSNGPPRAPSNLFQVIGKAFQIVDGRNEPAWKRDCDVLIEPDVTEFSWDDFRRADDIIKTGERAALAALPAVRALLQNQRGTVPDVPEELAAG
jgi:NTE family protein